ncbi:MAG: hypothetical protein J6Z49_09610 [Kiritimatiellae bacterium]|nr:hypothetical protein [Kiritimatiellia bacterium]
MTKFDKLLILTVAAFLVTAHVFAAHTENFSAAYADNVVFPVTLAYPAGGKPQVLRLDLGESSFGGYAVFEVASAKGSPVLRIAYANHPDGLGENGCFSRETSARYLGPTFDIPALPGNINRHELYRVCRTGLFVAPLIQGQERYVRIQLDTPGTEVTFSSFKMENAKVFREGKFAGTFNCSDPRLDKLWQISAWTCQIAAFPDHNAWKCAGGCLLPRKLEAAQGRGWCRTASPCDGVLTLTYEFDANPHFPQGRFSVLAGDRRVETVQNSTNEIRTVSVPIRKGERFGLAVEKESWPVIRKMQIVSGGAVQWQSRFDAPDGLDEWDFPRTVSYVADGAKRDRLIWSGDLWWAERNLFYSFPPGDEPYLRGSVELLGFNQTPAGYVHACPYAERAEPPADGEYGPFPSDEFAAWFIPVLCDYYLYSGDEATARKLYPNVLKLMDYLSAHTAEDGTFIQRAETSKHACNLKLGDTSHRAYMDILLWKCCRDAATMAADFGDGDGCARFEKWAAKLSTSIRSRFWNEQDGFFMLSDTNRGFGFEANALALASRFATHGEALRIAPHLKRTGHGKFQALAARGLMEYGFTDRGLKAIEAHNWFKLLDPGWKGARTTTECMGMIRRGWGDESHPDTAIAGILSAGVLGIVPTLPGYTKFEFRPHPCGGVSWARGPVPTPRGAIAAAWRMESGNLVASLTVPRGTTVSVALPDCAGVTVNGTDWTAGLDALAAGEYAIVAKRLSAAALCDPVTDGAGQESETEFRVTASSSHEEGGWSLRNLSKPMNARRAKGWSTKAHGSANDTAWLTIDFGTVKSVEKLELWARDDVRAVDGGVAGFPRSFVVEGTDESGAWRALKIFRNVAPPEPGKPFLVDFYTVIGYPKVKSLRIRAEELGAPAADEPKVWRLQFRRLNVVRS